MAAIDVSPSSTLEPLTRRQRKLLHALLNAMLLGLVSFAMVSDLAAPPPSQICKAFTFGESAFGSCDTFGKAPPQPSSLF